MLLSSMLPPVASFYAACSASDLASQISLFKAMVGTTTLSDAKITMVLKIYCDGNYAGGLTECSDGGFSAAAS